MYGFRIKPWSISLEQSRDTAAIVLHCHFVQHYARARSTLVRITILYKYDLELNMELSNVYRATCAGVSQEHSCHGCICITQFIHTQVRFRFGVVSSVREGLGTGASLDAPWRRRSMKFGGKIDTSTLYVFPIQG